MAKKAADTVAVAKITVIGTIIVAIVSLFGNLVLGYWQFIRGPGVGTEPTPTVKPSVLSVEQVPRRVAVFDSSDDDPNSGVAAEFRQIYDLNMLPGYEFTYDFSVDRSAGARLEFLFTNSINVAEYKSIDFTIQFEELGESLDLYLFDINDNKSFIHINSDGTEPSNRTYTLDKFAPVNLNAVRAISFYTQAEYNTGQHTITIQNIRFGK